MLHHMADIAAKNPPKTEMTAVMSEWEHGTNPSEAKSHQETNCVQGLTANPWSC